MANFNAEYQAASASYSDKGYFIAEQVLGRSEIQSLITAISRPVVHLCKSHGLVQPSGQDLKSLHEALKALKQYDIDLYLSALKASQQDPSVLAITAHPRLLQALAAIDVTEPTVALKPFPVLLSNDLHIEGGYNVRPLHQEWSVMRGSRDGVVCWIPLHDITERHNSLILCPSSHHKGVRPFERTLCGTGVTQDALPHQAPVRLSPKAGDAVIFSCFTVHGTSEQGEDLRIAISIRYNNLAASDFIRRGYYSPIRLVIDREEYTEDS